MAYVDPSKRVIGIFVGNCLTLIFLARFFSSLTGISVRASGWGFVATMLLVATIAGGVTWLALRLFPDPD